MAVKMHFSHGDHCDPSGRLPDPKSDTSMGDASALVAQTPLALESTACRIGHDLLRGREESF